MGLHLIIGLLVLICEGTLSTARSLAALDSKVWHSSVKVTLSDDRRGPLHCEFDNIAVDSSVMYFVVSQLHKRQQAASDLFNCCINIRYKAARSGGVCEGSVRPELCDCFSPFQYVASVITLQRARQGFTPLDGNTWLVHHWSESYSFGRFTSMIFDLQNLLFNTSDTSIISHDGIHQFLSLGYDSISGEDTMIMYNEMLYSVLGRKPHFYVGTNDTGSHFRKKYETGNSPSKALRRVVPLCLYSKHKHTLQDDYMHSMKNGLRRRSSSGESNDVSRWLAIGNTTLRNMLLESSDLIFPLDASLAEVCQEVRTLRVMNVTEAMPLLKCNKDCQSYYLQHAYMPPVRSGRVPHSHQFHVEGVQPVFKKYLQSYHSDLLETMQCVSNVTKSDSVRIAILQHFEVDGTQSFVNFDRMLLSIHKITSQEFIDVIFISNKTPAHMQALRFCNFHILVTPHSSHLSNLIFSPPGVSVIELQSETLEDDIYLWLGQHMNLHYQLLNEGNIVLSGSMTDAQASNRLIRMKISLKSFELALENAVESLRKGGYIL